MVFFGDRLMMNPRKDIHITVVRIVIQMAFAPVRALQTGVLVAALDVL